MDRQEQNQTLMIQPRRFLYVFLGVEILFLIFSLIGQYLTKLPNSFNLHYPLLTHDFAAAFDVNSEANITTYYSVTMALAASVLLFVIAYFKNVIKDKYRFHWVILSLFLLYISLDDASVIHEKTSKYLKGMTVLGGWFEYKWVILGIIVVGIFGISFFRFWLNLDTKYKILFLLSFGLFFGGAVGTELIGGRYAYSNGSKNFTYVFLTTIEQGLQYGGLTMLVYSLLDYIKSYFPQFSVSTTDLTATGNKENKLTLAIRPKRTLYILGGVGIIMVLLSFIGQYLILHPPSIDVRLPYQANFIRDYTSEFDFHAQPNIAIYYTMFVLDVASLFLFVVAHIKNSLKDRYRFYWTVFAWVVFFIAIDNLALIQNKIFEYFQDGGNPGGGWLKYQWMILAVLMLTLAFVLIGLWSQFDGTYKALFILSLALYFAGVLVKLYSHFTFTALEQTLQYGGATLLVYSVLLYLETHLSPFLVIAKE